MNPPQEIPGYYYDPERGKYFKILRNHIAPPGSPYSQENIKKRARDSKREKLAAMADSRQGRLQRSRILEHPLGGALTLPAELGRRGRQGHHDSIGRAIATSFDEQCALELPPPRAEILSFVQDPRHSGLFVVDKRSNGYRVSPCYPAQRAGFYEPPPEDNLSRGLSTNIEITCLALANRGSILCNGLSDDIRGASIVLSHVHEPSGRGNSYVLGPVLSLRRYHETAIWSCASAPTNDLFALGTNDSVLLLGVADYPPAADAIFTKYQASSDVLAVEFMSDFVLLAGQRNGSVAVIDRRLDQDEMAPMRFRHGACVTGLRGVDDKRIIVNGLEDSICMYDLRFPHPPSPMKSYTEPTRPVLRYEQHYNEYRINLGFDIDLETGLLAVGREDKQVHLYNLHTASKIHTRLTNRTFDDYPRCMQFSRTARPSRDPPSLLVGEGKNIWRWAW